MTNIGRADPGWSTIKHPSGWQYYWHPGQSIVVDHLRSSYPSLSFLTETESTHAYEAYEVFYPTSNPNPQIIDHEHQAATVPGMTVSNPTGILTGILMHPEHNHRRYYWEYIRDHPVHHFSGRLDKIVVDGVPEALEYLDWCSQATLLPSEVSQSTFTLTQCTELSRLLTHLCDRYQSKRAIEKKVQAGGPITTSRDIPQEWSPSSHAVLILTIAGVLLKKYELYDSKQFWLRDRHVSDNNGDTTPIDLLRNGFFYIWTGLLLFGPPRYLKILMDLDKPFIEVAEWRAHSQNLISHWKSSNLLATVLLSASVSFLAIPDAGTVAAVATLISTMTALGSVLSGLYCLAYYAYEDPAGDIFEFSNRYAANIWNHGKNRPIYTAVILSVPEASLLWSITSFAVATLAFNLSEKKISVGFVLVLIVFGILALGLGLVLGSLWYMWGTGSIVTRVQRPLHKLMARLRENVRMAV